MNLDKLKEEMKFLVSKTKAKNSFVDPKIVKDSEEIVDRILKKNGIDEETWPKDIAKQMFLFKE